MCVYAAENNWTVTMNWKYWLNTSTKKKKKATDVNSMDMLTTHYQTMYNVR